jgi:hypothetical protein
MTHVRSRDTDVPVSRSQAELERILRRFGAGSFGVQNDWQTGRAAVSFLVPDHPGGPPVIPVRLVVDRANVYDRLFGPTADADRTERRVAQAERVAWRHLVLWVDSACTAAGTGVQTMAETFLAHTLVDGRDGRPVRLMEQLDQDGGFRKLLAPPR